MQHRFGALGGSLVLGVVWWGFHVPSIVQSGQGRTLIVLGFFGALAFRVLWTWLFANTGGSVFAIIVVHAITNVCSAYVPTVPTSAQAPVLVMFAMLVTLLWGPRTLDRFRSPHARRSRRSARLGHERTAARADATRAAGTGRSSTTG